MTSLLLMLPGAMRPAAADEARADLDLDRTGSISVTVQTGDDVAVAGAQLTLYRVADPAVKQAALTFVPVAAFEGCGADLGDLGGLGSDTLAAELAAWVDAQGLEPNARVVTDAQGRAVFSKLACGLYLVGQTGGAEGFSTLEPFAVGVPMTSADGSGWVYDVAANPKVVEQPVEPEEPVAPEDPGQPAQPDDGKLPQTGLDLGVVGALAVGGVLVFSLGWALAFMGRRRRAEWTGGADGDGGDAR